MDGVIQIEVSVLCVLRREENSTYRLLLVVSKPWAMAEWLRTDRAVCCPAAVTALDPAYGLEVDKPRAPAIGGPGGPTIN
jgi:hypothetical protein